MWYSDNMPRKNAIREYGAGEYYHVYNRGASKMDIFREPQDYAHFLSLLKGYLTPGEKINSAGNIVPNYTDRIELIAYCLMPNHYHLFVYLLETDGLVGLMRSIMTSYSMYFNHKYKRTGTLFEGRFLASRITGDAYFWQVSRYIHLNPLDIHKDIFDYPYSSVQYFVGNWHAAWVHPEYVVAAHEKEQYRQELLDNKDWHEDVHRLRHILADSGAGKDS